MNFLSNELIVRFDETLDSVTISHPDRDQYPNPLVQIRPETYNEMSFDEMAAFVGARLLLLMPKMRDQFEVDIKRMRDR